MIGDIDGQAVININPVSKNRKNLLLPVLQKDSSGDSKKEKTPQPSSAALITSSSGKLIPNPEIDSLTDKPWQKPGADLSDYFNYGYLFIIWKVFI